MSIFDLLKRQAESTIKRETSKVVNNAVNRATQSVGKGKTAARLLPFLHSPQV